ncbi:MAG: ATP-binding protein [Acidobacteria bacterium]|nr:ATP-binding protein [Acidobacteriota bacterium]
MPLKPWYKVVTPREDLRTGKPLDASEFAVHLDQIRDRRAPVDYQDPERFFERTFLTTNLTGLASEVIRRLSGERTETSAVFNMATQFGGGKTHSLTLLYHLAKHGPAANGWVGVRKLLDQAGISSVPQAAVAVFVGTEFDAIDGRGGTDGTPHRRTAWGEIAFQLGGEAAFAVVAEHDRQNIAPGGDVIRKFLPPGPCIILMDELMNYICRWRKQDITSQFYLFLQNFSEEARARDNVVLAVSIPASELEMTAEDQLDYERLKKLLDRIGKAVMISAEKETSEIIRRRLFEFDPGQVGQDGKPLLTRDALATCSEYADWVLQHKAQLPAWFPADQARAEFAATFPFHPMVLSVFERKWQSLPRFQRTRGILRLLALWVSKTYQEGYQGGHKDALIGLGTAPLDDVLFRSALFEQMGESRLEIPITTDICGKPDAHAVRLDKEAVESVKKARLHRKVATTIFFESNGGQTSGDQCTVPEIRLAVAEPELDIGNVETVLDALESSSYYLSSDKRKFRFSLSPNLNKLLADRRASVQPPKIQERVQTEIRAVFAKGSGVDRIYFPEKSNQISDRPVLAMVVLAPEYSSQNERTITLIESLTRESGNSSRTYKSALIWCVCDSTSTLQEEARKLLAWEDIQGESNELRLDESQRRQLVESLSKAKRDLTECVWRSYKNVYLLGKNNQLRHIDLGLIHSSSANSILELIVGRLKSESDIEEAISPNFLVRNWPPAFTEWSTKAVRDAFFAVPQFPRLIKAEVIKDTIVKGVLGGLMAYVGKDGAGRYEPFQFQTRLTPADIELSDDVFIIKKELAEAYLKAKTGPLTPPPAVSPTPQADVRTPAERPEFTTSHTPLPRSTESGARGTEEKRVSALKWSGSVPFLKWTSFYAKVLTRFVAGKGINVTINIEIRPEKGISTQQIEETKAALRELGLSEDVTLEEEE